QGVDGHGVGGDPGDVADGEAGARASVEQCPDAAAEPGEVGAGDGAVDGEADRAAGHADSQTAGRHRTHRGPAPQRVGAGPLSNANSRESAPAAIEASMMLALQPTVLQRLPSRTSPDSTSTRVTAKVPAASSRMRTL